MDDLTTASPLPASRFEGRTRLEPRDYERLLRVVRWSIVEHVVGTLPIVGVVFIGAMLTSMVWQPLAERLPVVPYWVWSWAPMGGALLACILYKVFVYRTYMASMFRGQPIGMGETTFVADANGVNATSAGVVTSFPWDKVENVIVANEHLFLMFGRLTGLVIPRRSFANDSEAERFAGFVRSMTRKAA